MGSGSKDDKSINGIDGSIAVASMAEAIDHLYSLKPTEFVAARNDLVKAARSAGERELATAVKALRKPSMLASELNRLLRLDGERVEGLLNAALALRDGHQSVLSGEEVDLADLQAAHREAAAEVSAPAANHRDRLQSLLESASLDATCHDDLRNAAYVTEPAPALGFDLFSPRATAAEPAERDGDEAQATVSSISEARTRKRRREAAKKQQAAEREAADGSDLESKKQAARAEAEAEVAAAASAHTKAEAALALAYRQAEAAAKKHAKATERLAEAERLVKDARSQLQRADKSLTVTRTRSEAAEEKLSSTADVLRGARATLDGET